MILKIPVLSFHMRGVWFKSSNQRLTWRPQDLIDFIDLIDLIFSVEQRIFCNELKKDTAETPDIHLRPIITISQEALRRTVPSGCNIFCIWKSCGRFLSSAKISQLNLIPRYQNILWLDISMKQPFTMHIGYGFEYFIHIYFDNVLTEICFMIPDDGFIQILLHKFKNEIELVGLLVIDDLIQLNNVIIRAQTFECFYLLMIYRLFVSIKFLFHPLNSYISIVLY